MIYIDTFIFAQCRTCGHPMIGIVSIAAREDCYGCGGVALNIINKDALPLEKLVEKYGRKREKRFGTRL